MPAAVAEAWLLHLLEDHFFKGNIDKTVNESLKVGEELKDKANCIDNTNVSEIVNTMNNNDKTTNIDLVDAPLLGVSHHVGRDDGLGGDLACLVHIFIIGEVLPRLHMFS